MPKTDHGLTASNGIQRSPHWPSVEYKHKKLNPNCAVCNSTENIQVHHIFPFHYCVQLGRPDLELDDRNLISLCETEGLDHHLLVGHADDFKSSNLSVVADTLLFAGMTEAQIKADTRWIVLLAKRVKKLDAMSDFDKAGFVLLMNSTFPRL